MLHSPDDVAPGRQPAVESYKLVSHARLGNVGQLLTGETGVRDKIREAHGC